MSGSSVIVVGAGIAGPVLAILLKMRGYNPLVYDRLPSLADAGPGLSLMMQPNGVKILSLILGLVEDVECQEVSRLRFYSTLPEDSGLLGETPAPSTLKDRFGFPMSGVRRTELRSALLAALDRYNVPVKWGHELVSLEQDAEFVTAVFGNGERAQGGFLESAAFTGLTQTGGICLTPSILADQPTLYNWFGLASHIVAYPICKSQTAWALTLPEGEARETWRTAGQGLLDKLRTSTWADWDYGAGDLIRNTDTLVKYGIYDRPELKSWHQDRVVLLGDAAHPTSPHLGQGANQAFEDIWHLIHLLDNHNADRSPLKTAELEEIFSGYERLRIPRTSALVQGARKQGEGRVVLDIEACKARNEGIRKSLKDEDGFTSMYARVYSDFLALVGSVSSV